MICNASTRTATLAAALACAAPAWAQSSVTLYGAVDLSANAVRSGAPGTGRYGALSSSVGTPSRLGFRGSEDLGGGTKAVFQLEMGFSADTGALDSYAGDYASATPSAPGGLASTGFNRRAHVGLETQWGTLLLGREYTPMFYTALATDTFALNYAGNVQALIGLTGGSERLARSSNGIFYTSPQFGGLRMRAMYAFGSESTGGDGKPPKDANVFYGLQADYTAGGLVLSGAWQHIELPVVGGSPLAFTGVQARRDLMFGAQYRWGGMQVAAGHFRVSAPVHGEDTWIGAGYTFGANTIKAQVQRLRQDDRAGPQRRATLWGVVYEHALSKRTALYANYSRASNNATGRFGIVGGNIAFAAGAPGASPDVLALGVRHMF